MRRPRILAPAGEDAIYHCYSRIVGNEYRLTGPVRDRIVQKSWQIAEFLGLRILCYEIMSTHFHQILEVPGEVELSDEQLSERVRVYYGGGSREYRRLLAALELGGEHWEQHRQRYMNRMGQLWEYEKVLKQVISQVYNKQEGRIGALWAERFGSVWLQDDVEVLRAVSVYVNLNALRAQLVEDPAEYEHSSYAAALGGDKRCRAGICRVMGESNWGEAQARYRELLYIRGGEAVKGKAGVIAREQVLEVLRRKGELPLWQLLRLRVKYLTKGLVLGSEEFVEQVFEQYRSHFGERRRRGAVRVKELSGGRLHVLNRIRADAVQ